MDEQSVRLGRTDIQLSPLGIGTWAWGDREGWGYGHTYDERDIEGAFRFCIERGVTFFDTAEIYGRGASEELLGRFLKSSDRPVVVATKFAPLRGRFFKGTLLRALEHSLQRLQVKRVDLYQIHWHTRWVSVETWMGALARAVERGLTTAVGVSNYSTELMVRAHRKLGEHGIPLASNQVEYSLLCRSAEQSGLLAACNELGISLIAYSPIAMGLLSGKYHAANRPVGTHRAKYSNAYLTAIQGLITLLKTIGREHGGKTPSQVAINWVMCKGAVPIPGAKNKDQAEELLGALGWRLQPEEIKQLDAESAKLQ